MIVIEEILSNKFNERNKNPDRYKIYFFFRQLSKMIFGKLVKK